MKVWHFCIYLSSVGWDWLIGFEGRTFIVTDRHSGGEFVSTLLERCEYIQYVPRRHGCCQEPDPVYTGSFYLLDLVTFDSRCQLKANLIILHASL